MSLLSPSGGIIAVVLLYGVWRLLRIGHRPANYPPGPPTWPILGNLWQLPKGDIHIQYHKWAQKYGPIYSIMRGSQPVIVLSSAEIVRDLFDKRSNIYSDRPEYYLAEDIGSGGMRMTLMHSNPTWRLARKMTHHLLNVSATRRYIPYQELEDTKLVYDILIKPDDFVGHIERATSSLTSSIVYGFRLPTHDDPRVGEIFDNFHSISDITRKGGILDWYPFLRKLPDFLLETRRRARQHHKDELGLFLRYWLNAKDFMSRGILQPCFCIGMAKMQEQEGLSDAQAAYIAGIIFDDPTPRQIPSLEWCRHWHAIQKFSAGRKKAKIDRVVGTKRLPRASDLQDLPYVQQILRWCPTTIVGGLAHSPTRDDYYQGYCIPKGSTIVNNVWAIQMDPSRYPDPEVFRPERWQARLHTAKENMVGEKTDLLLFGAGRRICPGQHVGERSVFLATAHLLWSFNIEKARGEDGVEIPIEPQSFTSGIAVRPKSFKVSIAPREPFRAQVIRDEWDCARTELLDQDEQWTKVPEEIAEALGPA
ncbi:cytochrome P450 [Fusarium oxysporum f. sp. albedinis]|nr:cytochrome P450 [Fusarium oxysporum f. sp. albedinis]